MVTPLVQARCPRCRAPELFPARKVGKTVTCRYGDPPRFKLRAGAPFGADEWDACRVPGLLRHCLELHDITPSPRANACFAVALIRTVYAKSRSVWLRKAVAYAEQFLTTGTAS